MPRKWILGLWQRAESTEFPNLAVPRSPVLDSNGYYQDYPIGIVRSARLAYLGLRSRIVARRDSSHLGHFANPNRKPISFYGIFRYYPNCPGLI